MGITFGGAVYGSPVENVNFTDEHKMMRTLENLKMAQLLNVPLVTYIPWE
jgi:hypothetical protein